MTQRVHFPTSACPSRLLGLTIWKLFGVDPQDVFFAINEATPKPLREPTKLCRQVFRRNVQSSSTKSCKDQQSVSPRFGEKVSVNCEHAFCSVIFPKCILSKATHAQSLFCNSFRPIHMSLKAVRLELKRMPQLDKMGNSNMKSPSTLVHTWLMTLARFFPTNARMKS